MPRTKTIRILGIDPGTNETGIAITENQEILFWGVKTWKRCCSRSCKEVLNRARKEIGKLIEQYEPQVLVLESDPVLKKRGSETLNVLVKEIKSLARKQRIRISQFKPKAIKSCICDNERSSKMKVARELASRYPELNRYLRPGKGWNRSREKYWQKMFCALSLCLTHWDQEKSKHDQN